MTAEECEVRASECAANARLATNERLSVEFLALAARWRAMAVRDIFLGSLDGPKAAIAGPGALLRRPT